MPLVIAMAIVFVTVMGVCIIAEHQDKTSRGKLKAKAIGVFEPKTLYGVWLNLVEQHWNEVRIDSLRPDLSFAQIRQKGYRPKASIDKDVAELAIDYWRRNRFHLREHFINYCYFMSKYRSTFEVMKATNGGKIECKQDPVYPGKTFPNDVDYIWVARHMPLSVKQKKAAYNKSIGLLDEVI